MSHLGPTLVGVRKQMEISRDTGHLFAFQLSGPTSLKEAQLCPLPSILQPINCSRPSSYWQALASRKELEERGRKLEDKNAKLT